MQPAPEKKWVSTTKKSIETNSNTEQGKAPTNIAISDYTLCKNPSVKFYPPKCNSNGLDF